MDAIEDIHPGDFLIIRVDEPTLSPELTDFFQEFRPIGVHFGKEAFVEDTNYENWMSAYKALKTGVLEATGRDKMIWALDHEGGRVHRVPPPITRFSYPLNWAEQAGQMGRIFAEQLTSLGINVLFGPSLDIYSNPENKVIGPRAFGKSAVEVDEYSEAFIRAIEKKNIIPTIKHFPGHGDTLEDSHFELPILKKDLGALEELELLPFRYAINGGAMAVMLAHILFPEIDSEYPASLSAKIAKELLRDTLNYSYVTFTDDLDMKAISERYSPEQIATQLLSCETNFAIFNHSLEHAGEVAKNLEGALKNEMSLAMPIHERTVQFMNYINQPEVDELSYSVIRSHEQFSESVPERHDIAIKEFTGD